MRRPIIAYMDNGLPVQLLSRRDFLYPDADEKYVPAVLAYIHDTDVETLNTLLRTRTPDEVVATFRYLSDREKQFACRTLFDQWAERLAAGGRPMLTHLMEWMTRQKVNGLAADDPSYEDDLQSVATVIRIEPSDFNIISKFRSQCCLHEPFKAGPFQATAPLGSRPESPRKGSTRYRKGLRCPRPRGQRA